MGDLIKAEFKTRLSSRLKRFDPEDLRRDYQSAIFRELYSGFPQFKAHVAAFIERHYCIVLNDEDHPDADSALKLLSDEEVRMQNAWILNRHGGNGVAQRERPEPLTARPPAPR